MFMTPKAGNSFSENDPARAAVVRKSCLFSAYLKARAKLSADRNVDSAHSATRNGRFRRARSEVRVRNIGNADGAALDLARAESWRAL